MADSQNIRRWIQVTESMFSADTSATISTSKEFPTIHSSDLYQAYKFSVAMANHEEAHQPESPVGTNAMIVAYTDEELDIIKSAEKKTGHRGQLVTSRGSKEPKGTEHHSPVAKIKKNRYGV